MTLYHDPQVEAARPTLIGDLLGIPATDKNHQLENQATTVLAWLIDRSPSIARTVLRLFLGNQVPDGTARVGARTQLSLPKPDGGALYPDLSICMAEHKLQLLVEVKVDSDFAVYEDGQLQPQAYRNHWRHPVTGDATVRAVGTLTRTGGSSETDTDQLIARDVAWRKLRDDLHRLLTRDEIEPDCRLITASFVAAIDERIAPTPPPPGAQRDFFNLHEALLDAVKDTIAELIRGTGAPKRIRGNWYFGSRIPLPSATDAPLFLRLYLSPQSTRLNLPGKADSLIAAPEHNADGAIEKDESAAVEAAGFTNTKDLANYRLHRHLWPLQDLDSRKVANELAAMLAKTGLLLDAATRPSN